MKSKPETPVAYLERHAIFRLEDFTAAHRSPTRSAATIRSLLRYHVSTGRLRNVRRGLYASAQKELDPWVLASRLSSDAVLAYDGALSFHHLGGDDVRISFLTRQQVRPFTFEQVEYTPVRPPSSLGTRWRAEVIEVERAGEKVFVTSIERTLVDALDRLDLLRRSEDIDEIAEKLRRCFVSLDLDNSRMVTHARNLGGGLLAARLGFLLEHLPNIRARDLELLEKQRPRSPAYFDRTLREEETMVFMRRWNLMVPKRLWLRVARGAT